MVVAVGIIGVGFIPSEDKTENLTRVVHGVVRDEVSVETPRSVRTERQEDPVTPPAMTRPVTMSAISDVKPLSAVRTVPFFSQFNDISSAQWRGVGCGIASLAMLIEYYDEDSVNVDTLLGQGVAMKAFLPDAGWTHAGLIALANKYGLDGSSVSLAHLTMSDAFAALETEVEEGPVMVSVHYTFEPTNPIPHLVVVNGVKDGKIYYNDPAEKQGGGSISIEKFKSAWKKRYIAVRPT